MSEAESQQILEAHFSHVLQGLQKAPPSQHEPAASAAQKPVRIDDGWERMIDARLIEWGRDPTQLDEEGTVTPSKQTIQFAIGIAVRLRDMGLPAPTRVVPDAHGGIVFEFHEQSLHVTFRLSPDLSLDYCAFDNCRLVQRQKLASPLGADE